VRSFVARPWGTNAEAVNSPPAPGLEIIAELLLDGFPRDLMPRGGPVRPREQTPYGRLFYTPYWTTFELPTIDMKAASVGILDQTVARLRWWSLRKSRGGSGARDRRPATVLAIPPRSRLRHSPPVALVRIGRGC